MPDVRRHRGPHPQDRKLFAPEVHDRLRAAVHDLSWLLTRGYAPTSSLKIVGDRFRLNERQRRAVLRSACSDQQRADRAARLVPVTQWAGAHFEIDGFNLLTTIEAALSGGVLLRGRDGCVRDLASMHGSYRTVEETRPALQHIGGCLAQARVATCHWWLDQPVSNSGRLRRIVEEVAAAGGWSWTARLSPNPDAVLIATQHIVATADSLILDRCGRWCNLAAHVVASAIPDAEPIDLT